MNVYPAGYFRPFHQTSFESSVSETAVQKAVAHVSASLFVGGLSTTAAGQRRWPFLHCRIDSDSVSQPACFHQVYGGACNQDAAELFWGGGCAAEASVEETNAESTQSGARVILEPTALEPRTVRNYSL